MRLILLVILGLSLSLGALAANTGTLTISATVPSSTGLTLAVNRVDSSGNWHQDRSNLEFGTLAVDPTYNILRASNSYAVDVSVVSNSADWNVTHTVTSLAGGGTNLDNKVNVTFAKAISGNPQVDLTRVSYTNSNNQVITKSQVSGGWLRVYYGVATGSGDASGVIPVPLTQAPVVYTGQVTFTLTNL